MWDLLVNLLGIIFCIAIIILQIYTLFNAEWIRSLMIWKNDNAIFPEHNDGYNGPSDYQLRKYQFSAFYTIPVSIVGIIYFIIKIIGIVKSLF